MPESSDPADGATDHYYRDPIVFTMEEPISTATVSGIDGTTEVSEDGRTITFTPDALEPSTSYTVRLDYCGGLWIDLSFTTSDLGAVMDDPSALVGRTYGIDLQDANFVRPEGAGDVFALLIEAPLLLGVVEVGASLELMGAMGVAGGTTQDYCAASFDLPTASFDDPHFAAGPQDVLLAVEGGAIPFKALAMSGTFAADGSYFGGGTLSGSLDMRDVSAALPTLGYTQEALCELMVSFGAACAACDDGEPFCMDIEANQITAEQVPGTLIELPASDCPGCDAGAPTCE